MTDTMSSTEDLNAVAPKATDASGAETGVKVVRHSPEDIAASAGKAVQAVDEACGAPGSNGRLEGKDMPKPSLRHFGAIHRSADAEAEVANARSFAEALSRPDAEAHLIRCSTEEAQRSIDHCKEVIALHCGKIDPNNLEDSLRKLELIKGIAESGIFSVHRARGILAVFVPVAGPPMDEAGPQQRPS